MTEPSPPLPNARFQLSPSIFWTALFALLLIGLIGLDSITRLDAARLFGGIALTVVFFLGATALAWHRWGPGRGAQWFLRAAALVGLAVLVPVMWDWLCRSEVFMQSCCRDKSLRVATFWPLLQLWIGGLLLAGFVLWGAAFRWQRGGQSAFATPSGPTRTRS